MEFGGASESFEVGENLNFELLLEKRSEKIKMDEERAKEEERSEEEECEFDPYNVQVAKLPLDDDVSGDDVTCENEKANRLFVKCLFIRGT